MRTSLVCVCRWGGGVVCSLFSTTVYTDVQDTTNRPTCSTKMQAVVKTAAGGGAPSKTGNPTPPQNRLYLWCVLVGGTPPGRCA